MSVPSKEPRSESLARDERHILGSTLWERRACLPLRALLSDAPTTRQTDFSAVKKTPTCSFKLEEEAAASRHRALITTTIYKEDAKT